MCPSRFIEGKRNAGLMQRLADEITSLWRHMVVHLAEDHDEFALDVFRSSKRVVVLACAERSAVDVGGEVTYR